MQDFGYQATFLANGITRLVCGEIDTRAIIRIFSIKELETLIGGRPVLSELLPVEIIRKRMKFNRMRAEIEPPPLDRTLGLGIGILLRFMKFENETYRSFLIRIVIGE